MYWDARGTGLMTERGQGAARFPVQLGSAPSGSRRSFPDRRTLWLSLVRCSKRQSSSLLLDQIPGIHIVFALFW